MSFVDKIPFDILIIAGLIIIDIVFNLFFENFLYYYDMFIYYISFYGLYLTL